MSIKSMNQINFTDDTICRRHIIFLVNIKRREFLDFPINFQSVHLLIGHFLSLFVSLSTGPSFFIFLEKLVNSTFRSDQLSLNPS